jgi:hypothetical protein
LRQPIGQREVGRVAPLVGQNFIVVPASGR